MKNWIEELELEETVSKKKADFYFQKESIPVHLDELDRLPLTREVKKKEFTKDDSAKIDIMAMNFHEVVQVLEFGAKKYGADNWKACDDVRRYKQAMMRHMFAYINGEEKDAESGLSHLSHLACNVLFLRHFEKLGSK